MARFIVAVNTIDKIFDCVPIVSTVKNAGIFLYQLVHKVNKVANPVNTSWKDDIKIHVLSKNQFIAKISMIPIFGNFIAISFLLADAIEKYQGIHRLGYLRDATKAWNWGLKKHNYEVVALYLARNPQLSEEELKEDLRFAAQLGNEEVVKLILNSRNNWSSDSIEEVLKSTTTTQIAKIILNKYSVTLTDKQAGSVVSDLAGRFMQNNYDLICLLIKTYPNMDNAEVGEALLRAAGKKDARNIVSLLINNFHSKIDENAILNALKIALKTGSNDNAQVIFDISPEFAKKHINNLITDFTINQDMLNWLLAKYPTSIISSSIVKVLTEATVRINPDQSFIENIIDKYPDLSPKDLEPVMVKAARVNFNLFKCYIEKFKQLKPENLQDILNVLSHNDFAFSFGVGELIQQKFPTLTPVPPA